MSGLFPWGTLVVNLLGCGALGFLSALWTERMIVDPWWRSLLGIGVLGGFTTFSTFGLETWMLWSSGSRFLALANAFGSVGLGILGVALGSAAARALAG
jgi:CrcB protein